MCGEWMKLAPVAQINRIAGTAQTSRRHVLEWQCPDCDYFEEAEGQFNELSSELEAWLNDPE